MKEKIARWHKMGLWTTAMVRSAVGRKFSGVEFTAADFEEITGEKYTA